MPRFIRSACLTHYVPIARSVGLDPYRLLKQVGLDRSCLVDSEIKIPVGEVCRLLESSAHVYEQLSTGRGGAEQTASSIGMDRRTLHRHLLHFGETFSSIVDEVRSDLALRYLEERRQSLNEVARLLGFSAPSAFSRWFRTRFGCTPKAWRTTDRNMADPR